MPATIRQEINIVDGELVTEAASAVVSISRVQLDTTQYNGTVTYYFEAEGVRSSVASTPIMTLRRAGTSTDDATISLTASAGTYGLFRSASFTPPTGQTDYVAAFSTGFSLGQIKSARIVIIQSATALTNTETQIEIGNNESQTINNVYTALTKPKYWKYTAANWDGTKTFYVEVVGKRDSSTMSSSSWQLEEADGTGDGFTGWASKVVIINATTSTTAARTRVSFTPTDGRNYRITSKDSDTMNGGHTTYNAKIIVDQTDYNTASYYFDASIAGPTDIGGVWTSDANAFDNDATPSTFATTTTTVNTNDLNATGTTAPTGNTQEIISVEARLYASHSASGTVIGTVKYSGVSLGGPLIASATPNWSGYTILTVPSGGWTWTKVTNLLISFNNPFGTAGTINVYKAEVRVTYRDSALDITKLEPQYLLANTSLAVGTALQTFLTKWDSTEWDAGSGTIGYTHWVDAANGSTSVIEVDTAAGTQVTGSVVTSPDNGAASSAMTMPANGNLDMKATTNNSDVYGSRILVAYVFSAAAPTPPFFTHQNIYLQSVNRASTY